MKRRRVTLLELTSQNAGTHAFLGMQDKGRVVESRDAIAKAHELF